MQFLNRGYCILARYVGNRPNPLCWNDPFPFQQGIEAIGCEVLERLKYPPIPDSPSGGRKHRGFVGSSARY